MVNYIHCFVGRGACNLPTAVLDNVPMRAFGVWHSPVRFADSHRQVRIHASRETWWTALTKAMADLDLVQANGAYLSLHGLGFQYIAEFSSIWFSVFYFLQGKKKIKGRNKQRLFPRQTLPTGCATSGFPWLLGAIKCCFKGQSLNFLCTQCVSSYLVG
jgi:hypothetical protein